jgi:hypothetical protein
MVYKQARHKILIALFVITFFITFISTNWKMWFILPTTIGFLYLAGKIKYI